MSRTWADGEVSTAMAPVPGEVEMAQITPPVGFNLFVLQGMANRDMAFIAKSAFPLFLLMILAVIIIIIFPEIALWLPNKMSQNII